MKSKTLSKTDIKKLNEQTLNLYGVEFFGKRDFVQLFENDFKYLVLNKEPVFFYYGDKIVPFLKFLFKNVFLKEVVVDMGAVKFICGGADVMRPGITMISEGIERGDIVVIVDEKNNTPLVVGESLFSSQDMKEMSDGKVIKNIHFVSDNKWDL